MLTVNEIYLSIQGESTHVGRPCTFVRLTACDLRCRWCDTPDAFTGGRKMRVEDIAAEVERLGCRVVEITGGEPLLQREVYALMETLLGRGFELLLETGGHVPIDEVPAAVRKIVDVKCPGSGEVHRMHWPNLDLVSSGDEVKFVIADRVDFDYACDVVVRHDLPRRVQAVLFSPVHGELHPAELARWILDAQLPVRLQLQMHKYVWGADAKGV